MPSKQSYLTKKFRGRYVERLIEFLCSLDKDWSWQTTYYINSLRENDSTAYCKMYCQENGKLVLIKLDMIERDVDVNIKGVRFIVKKVGERNYEKEPEMKELFEVFDSEKLL